MLAWCPYRERRAQIVRSLEEGRGKGKGVVLILIRYKIDLGQEKAFSQSESHIVTCAYKPNFPSF